MSKKKPTNETPAARPLRYAHLFTDADAPEEAQKKTAPAVVLYGEEAVAKILTNAGITRPAAIPKPTPRRGKLALACRNSCKRSVSRKSDEYRQHGLCDVCGDREEMARFRKQMLDRASQHEAEGNLDGARDAIESIPKEARPAFISTDRERARAMLREILSTLPLAWIVGELNEGQSKFEVTMGERKRRANGKK